MAARLIEKIARFDAHHRFIIALAVSGGAYFMSPDDFNVPARITSIWVTFALMVLALSWTAILVLHPRDLPKLSRMQDSSRTWILFFSLAAALASLFAVKALLNSMDANRQEHLVLPVLAVGSAWSLVHTVFTHRYAHLYYGSSANQKKRPGGLDFSDDTEPDYLDFAYFSFVIGMTSQVSDVTIGSKVIRRTALAHGVLSFVFNVVIIALTISSLSN
jgi:uncharacterized membrane protein